MEGVIWEWWGAEHPTQVSGDVDVRSLSLGRQWPAPVAGDAPEDSPPTVANYFAQGTSSLKSGNFDAAGLMFRKCLESATKLLDPDLTRLSLVKRIEALVDGGKLTHDMGLWAHEVRLGGNEAAHEDEPFTADEAQTLQYFLESFLRYSFTLPSAVRRRSSPDESSN